MRALTKVNAGPGLELVDRPEPTCGPLDVKVRVLRAGNAAEVDLILDAFFRQKEERFAELGITGTSTAWPPRTGGSGSCAEANMPGAIGASGGSRMPSMTLISFSRSLLSSA